jgi:hypothetical protein
MKMLFIWGLATAIAALVSGLKAVRHGQWRRAALTFVAALACAAAVCVILIRHGNVMRGVNQMQPASQPIEKHRDPATADDGVHVIFHALAALFRGPLGCRNALYLDGVISRFYLPAQDPSPPAGDFAGMFAVTAR